MLNNIICLHKFLAVITKRRPKGIQIQTETQTQTETETKTESES